ncbi:hypothetical protein GCM10027258_79600 [Amycolatopsis stemonae]
MSTPIDTGNHAGSETGADAEFTTADFALLASKGNWDAQAPSQAAASANADSAANIDRATPIGDPDAEGWNSVVAKQAKKTEQKHVAANTTDKKSRILTAAAWTPGDYTAAAPADLGALFAEHRERCQAIDAPIGRGLYHVYAGSAATVGVALNVLSYITAKLSALLTDPKNSSAPGSLEETVAVHARRAQNTRFVVGKVLYSGWATVSTPTATALNLVSWLAAQSAVAVNDPRRLGRVLLAALFAAIVIAGVTMVAG